MESSTGTSGAVVPLLNALSTNPLPRGIDFRAAVSLMRPAADRYGAVIVFEMPMKDITFRALDPEPTYRTHTSFLALVKDSQGMVVGKLSRDLPMNQPKANLQGFQSGRVIFTYPLSLAAGRYTIESAAADVEGNKVAARKTVLIVPKVDESVLSISSPVLVRRLDEAPANPQPGDPFIVGTKRVVPTLQDHVPGGPKNALSFFFTIYPGANTAKVAAGIEFFLEEQSLGSVPVDLPAPQPDGSIAYIATIPLANFKPGLYEVKVRALQGQQVALRSLFVTID